MRFLDQWQKVIHARNREKGFYDYEKDLAMVEAMIAEPRYTMPILGVEALKRVLADYRRAQIERKILLTIGELCEAHEELRSGHAPNEVYYNQSTKPEGFPIEMADAAIRHFDVMAALGLDLETYMEQKHQYNGTRPYKHGRAF